MKPSLTIRGRKGISSILAFALVAAQLLIFMPAFKASADSPYSFEDDFELGNGYGGWTATTTGAGASLACDSSTSCMNTNSSKCTVTGQNTTSRSAYAYKSVAAQAAMHVRGYLYFESSDMNLIGNDFVSVVGLQTYDAAVVACARIVKSSGKLVMGSMWRNSSGPFGFVSSAVVSAGSWHCVELRWTNGSGSGEVRVWLDGTEVCSNIGLNTNGYVPQRVICNSFYSYLASTSNATYYLDALVHDTEYIGMSSDVAVTSVVPIQNVVPLGNSVDVNVAVENQGITAEATNVTLYANDTTINSICSVILPRWSSTSLAFTWNTTGFALGSYILQANISSISGETDLSDNALSGGMVTVGIHDVAVIDVEASPSTLWIGEAVSINVTIQNEGNYNESFNVTVHAGLVEVQTFAVNDLLAGETAVLSYEWNTTGMASGDYGFLATAETVAEETHTSDNTYEDGTVTLLEGIHDVAVINVTPLKTAVGQGYSLSINTTFANEGNFTESFNLTLFARNESSTVCIDTVSVADLLSGETRMLTIVWTTGGWCLGNYTILACSGQVPNEAHVEDNTREGGLVSVVLPGDVTADGLINMIDLYLIAKNFGDIAPYATQQIANCDIDDSGIINMLDLFISAKHFGETPCASAVTSRQANIKLFYCNV